MIPVLNAQRTLPEQLQALASQECGTPWEVVIADNDSTDGSASIAQEWLAAQPRPGALVQASGQRSASHARNAGSARARGDLLAFTDAGDVVAPGWLRGLTAAATYGDLVAGRLEVEELNDPLVRSWYGDPRDDRPFAPDGFLAFASGPNLAVWRDVFQSVGGWDEALIVGEDIDFSWRTQQAGGKLVFAPDAVVRRRYRASLRALAVQQYEEGKAGPLLYRRFRGSGMEGDSIVEAARAWSLILRELPRVPWSRSRQGGWVGKTARRCGRAAGSVRHRVVFP